MSGPVYTPDDLLTMQRSLLAQIQEMRGAEACDVDQAELLSLLLRVAQSAVDLDAAMTSGKLLPTPWQRSIDYRTRTEPSIARRRKG